MTTEDAAFVDLPQAAGVDLGGPQPRVRFARPAAIILRTV
jgi:hypothetical protein